MTTTKKLPPIAPGEMLRDVLDAAGLSANAAALKMRIPNNRLIAILHGQRVITPDTALRLARLFGTSAEMWMNLQLKYDLDVAEDELAEAIAREVDPYVTPAVKGHSKVARSLVDRKLASRTRSQATR